MKTEVLPASDPNAIRYAADVLRYDGLVAFPTDTVYGVGATAFKHEVVARLYPLKGRSTEKSIAVLVADQAGMNLIADVVSPEAERLAERFWPGAVTLVVVKRPEVPESVSPDPTVAVRVPAHPVALALLAAAGPLAVTSANRSGQPSALTAEEVLEAIGGRIDLLLDGGRSPGRVASTVVDCTVQPPRVLRHGPVSEDEIRKALEGR